ncbi:type VI secretion system baseplate subunit TssK [Cronobacter malonaticus]|uniref:type VI secretion system baseplate subunit TssK n=1 Tax=Cronobacter malonaticus TaxID=413503 RepID=UPI000CFAB2D0|nr:type VI secretion system baseplate subunit TssK [Cronobacter malonaticus]EGT4281638.1 type VI secretion system baseplate subunit TssK [Cronobacter malonaticus]EGT4287328.1 type VI secretion system baseplate subunit TssK [Cronobacter malonaticus]EGT4298635.1 type VI secretion system baseplate subunit TssK [Cronobacter malonaticus]EGT4312500.1 type VI secretion system baseplate subunit TssK [Cronobacter malonaticus]EGT4336132.1 type VI secretion system baseplate subunit TssK [Cronobacter malo
MKIYRPLWNEGALLSPQQFQQQSAWEAFTNAGVSALSTPFPWGVESVELDDELLSSGRIQVRALRLWLPDGTLVDTLNSDIPPPPRELNPGELAGQDSVTLLLALPLMQPGIINVQKTASVPERPLRYREEWVSLPDVFGSEEESVAVAHFNLALRFGHENNESWQTCSVSRLVRDGHGGWRQDASFIPPMALFSASAMLRERLVLLNRQLRSRRQRLMSMRRESNERLADFAVADVSLFWLLNALNSHARVLSEYERFPARHPEQVWAELARLAGSMLTFSLEHDLDVIPGYDHAEPEHTFPRLFDLITELLEASLPSRVIALPMTRLDELTWKTSLHDMRLREEADFYLSVRSDIPAWHIAERFPALCKAGSPDEVNAVSISALNGIPLIPVTRVPAALPVRLENHYFALDMESVAARDMLEQGVCMFYVPSLLGALEIELFAVLRS